MKKFALAAAVAAAALMAVPGVASAQMYAGAAYTNFDADGAEIDAVTGRLGYRMNPNFAIEGEGSVGLGDEDDVELNHNLGAYAMAILPVGSSFDLHARAGYQTTEIDTPIGEFEDDGLAYGFGGTWNVSPTFGIRADWTRLEGDEDDADAISLGGTFKF